MVVSFVLLDTFSAAQKIFSRNGSMVVSFILLDEFPVAQRNILANMKRFDMLLDIFLAV